MNELEARRQLLADPRHLSPELRGAIAQQPALGEFRDELLDLDQRMHAALTEPPLPNGLADRLVLRARFPGTPTLRLAMAAAVAAAAIAIPWYFVQPEANDQLAMLNHVRESTWELSDNPGVPHAVARAALAELGVGLADSAVHIRHLGRCVVAGRQGRHFTIDGPQGIVSFVILPASRGAMASDSLGKGETVGVYEQRGDVLLGAFADSSMERAALRKLMNGVFT